MLQARNYRVLYRLRAWSLLDMSVALRDLRPRFQPIKFQYQTCCSVSAEGVITCLPAYLPGCLTTVARLKAKQSSAHPPFYTTIANSPVACICAFRV